MIDLDELERHASHRALAGNVLTQAQADVVLALVRAVRAAEFVYSQRGLIRSRTAAIVGITDLGEILAPFCEEA